LATAAIEGAAAFDIEAGVGGASERRRFL
jgi:hypothetical protein